MIAFFPFFLIFLLILIILYLCLKSYSKSVFKLDEVYITNK